MPRLVQHYCLPIFAALVFVGTVQANPSQVSPSELNPPHVLFSFDRKSAETSNSSAQKTAKTQAPVPPTLNAIAETQKTVVSATHEEIITEEPQRDSRRLGPMTRKELLLGVDGETTPSRGPVPFEVPHLDSLGTAGAGLAMVVGLFLLCVALLKRSGPSPTSPLPQEAVAVLGRVPLMPKQYAHLLQVGNKLVLVTISGERTDTITEITEPAEVDRLLALCMKGARQSSSAEFQRVLGQISKESTRGFLGREAAYSRSARG